MIQSIVDKLHSALNREEVKSSGLIASNKQAV